MEQQVGEEAVPLDQDPCREREPDGGDDRCSGKKFLHRVAVLSGEGEINGVKL